MTAPQPNTGMYTAVREVFSAPEMERIIALGEGLKQDKAELLGPVAEAREQIRITRTSWIPQDEQARWIYQRIQQCAMMINDQRYCYDLTGFAEPMQYSVYHGNEGGHYDWHVDQGPTRVRRKLSISVQLSDPADYEGGVLEFAAGRHIEQAPRDKGALIAFPSFITHRVAPVTAGTRRSLVIWITGPAFR